MEIDDYWEQASSLPLSQNCRVEVCLDQNKEQAGQFPTMEFDDDWEHAGKFSTAITKIVGSRSASTKNKEQAGQFPTMEIDDYWEQAGEFPA